MPEQNNLEKNVSVKVVKWIVPAIIVIICAGVAYWYFSVKKLNESKSATSIKAPTLEEMMKALPPPPQAGEVSMIKTSSTTSIKAPTLEEMMKALPPPPQSGKNQTNQTTSTNQSGQTSAGRTSSTTSIKAPTLEEMMRALPPPPIK